jgi:hypothetical protein
VSQKNWQTLPKKQKIYFENTLIKQILSNFFFKKGAQVVKETFAS